VCCTWLTEYTGHKSSPSVHHHTTLSCYILATKTCIDNRKKTCEQQYLLHISSQYDELQLTNGWDWLASLGDPSKFQWVSHLCVVSTPMSLSRGPPNFARCLAVSWAGTLYINFRALLLPNGILPGAKFILCPSLAFSYIGSMTGWSSVARAVEFGYYSDCHRSLLQAGTVLHIIEWYYTMRQRKRNQLIFVWTLSKINGFPCSHC